MGKFHPTPAIIEAAFELLRIAPPFKSWKLPEADDVEFHVTKLRNLYGSCTHIHDGPGRGTKRYGFEIKISVEDATTLPKLLAILAHEMIHLAESVAFNRWDVAHGKAFKARERVVRRYHDFGPHELWK